MLFCPPIQQQCGAVLQSMYQSNRDGYCAIHFPWAVIVVVARGLELAGSL